MTQIVQWRAAALSGDLTLDQMREAVKALRANRLAAATASAKALKGTKPKKEVRSADDLLGDLEGM
jgi:hypothetical protein